LGFGRSWPVGFDVTHRLGGGPWHDAGVAVGQLDGQRGLGDVDGDSAVGVDSAEGDFWPQIMITPLFEARRCARTGSIDGRGGGPAGRTPRSRMILA
jgi:hypothetical protein